MPSASAIRIVHPFPSLLAAVATVALAFVAADGSPPAGLVLRMAAMMLCAQCAIGVTNDIFDRDLDAATKPWKPVPAGLVSGSTALVLVTALLLSALALAATLGLAGCLLAIAGTACGLAYDVRLKRTALSALPFMAAVPILPIWVWATLGDWENALWWLVPLGALIGLSVHLVNTVPDIEEDRAHGVRGLAHWLGAQRSMQVAWISFGLAILVSALIAPMLDYDLRWYIPAIAAGCAAIAASVGLFTAGRESPAAPLSFGVLAIGAVIVAAGWLAAVT
jgi:4-hydroxybenzoate polyprenyltransferase